MWDQGRWGNVVWEGAGVECGGEVERERAPGLKWLHRSLQDLNPVFRKQYAISAYAPTGLKLLAHLIFAAHLQLLINAAAVEIRGSKLGIIVRQAVAYLHSLGLARHSASNE